MQLHLALVGIVVSDMAASLAFYRRLGLPLPQDAEAEPHVEVVVGGVRFAFDTEDVLRSFDPDWTPPSPGGHRLSLAFECASPAEVDAPTPTSPAPATTVTSPRGMRCGVSATPWCGIPTATRWTCSRRRARGNTVARWAWPCDPDRDDPPSPRRYEIDDC